MNSENNVPSVIDPLVADLTNVASEFSEAFERRPTLNEFLQVLTEGIKWSRDVLLSDVNGINVEALQARMSSKRPAKPPIDEIPMTELTEAVLTASCNAVSGASSRVLESTGERPTFEAFTQLIARALQSCPDEMLLNVSPKSVEEITGKVKKKGRVTAKAGDVVAIPAIEPADRYFLACVIAKNSFGTAFGFFRGLFSPTPPAELRTAPVLAQPIHSGEQCLAAGKWFIAGHDDKLLELFPAEPEIYHRPSAGAPFGQAETASGKLRKLTKEEADSVGLLNGTYRQTYTCDFLQKRLKQLLNVPEQQN